MYVDFDIKVAKGGIIAETPSGVRWLISPNATVIKLPNDFPYTNDIYVTKTGIVARTKENKWKFYAYGEKGIVELPSDLLNSLIDEHMEGYDVDRMHIAIGAGVDREEGYEEFKNVKIFPRMPMAFGNVDDSRHFDPPKSTKNAPYVYVDVLASTPNGYTRINIRKKVDNSCVVIEEALDMLKEKEGREISVDNNLSKTIKRTVISTPDSTAKLEIFNDEEKKLIHVIPEIVFPVGSSIVNFKYKHNETKLMDRPVEELKIRVDKGLESKAGFEAVYSIDDESRWDLGELTKEEVDGYSINDTTLEEECYTVSTLVASVPFTILHTIPFAVGYHAGKKYVYFIRPDINGVASRISRGSLDDAGEIKHLLGYLSIAEALQVERTTVVGEEMKEIVNLRVASVFAINDKGEVYAVGNVPLGNRLNYVGERQGAFSLKIGGSKLITEGFHFLDKIYALKEDVEQINIANVNGFGHGDFVIYAKLKNGKVRVMWNASHNTLGLSNIREQIGSKDIDIQSKDKQIYMLVSNHCTYDNYLKFIDKVGTDTYPLTTYPVVFKSVDKAEIYPLITYSFLPGHQEALENIKMDKLLSSSVGILFKPEVVTGDREFGMFLSVADLSSIKGYIDTICK